MKDTNQKEGLTRRELLARSMAAGAGFVVGSGYVASKDAAWAMETAALKPETMATLFRWHATSTRTTRSATSIMPSRSRATTPTPRRMVAAGVAELDAAAQGRPCHYLCHGWEKTG